MNSAACSTCGSKAPDRLYATTLDRATCEQCLLEAKRSLMGLEASPYESFVESLAAALDLREHETGLHSKRVALNTLVLAREFYTDPDSLREVYWGSLLHDIGKIGVPDAILLKHKRLTKAEWEVMRQHPEHGYRILEKIPILALASEIVLCHEERYDGSGYPSGLRGEAIPLAARLFAVIDALDAMCFDRPYRKAVPFDRAKAEILRYSGSQFDPKAVAAFLKLEERLREITALEFRLPEQELLPTAWTSPPAGVGEP